MRVSEDEFSVKCRTLQRILASLRVHASVLAKMEDPELVEPAIIDQCVSEFEQSHRILLEAFRILDKERSPIVQSRGRDQLRESKAYLDRVRPQIQTYSRHRLLGQNNTPHPSTQSSSDSLGRSQMMAEESLAMGQATLENLHTQRETIASSQRKMGAINSALDYADYLLKGMSSWKGALVNTFKKPTTTSHPAMHAPRTLETNPSTSSHPRSSPPITTTDVDTGTQMLSDKQVQNQRIDALSATLTQLHHVARTMENEVDLHNEMLNEMDTSVDGTAVRLQTSDARIKRLM